MSNQRLDNIDLLKGLGAVAICLYHFGTGFLPVGHWAKMITDHLHLGVDVFLIVTGFTITYTLTKQNYTTDGFKKYLLTRWIRIDLPYYVSVLLALGLALGSLLLPQYKWEGLDLNFWNIFLHFFHLNDIVGRPWLHEVYWTLAIQIQFYIVAGLIQPIYSKPKIWIFAFLGIFWGLHFFFPKAIFLFFSPLFVAGIVSALYYFQKINWIELLVIQVFLTVSTYIESDWYHTIALAATVLVMQFPKFGNTITTYLGKISYSVYLTHLTIGWSLIGFLLDTFPNLKGNEGVLIIVGTLVSLAFAELYYRWVEEPTGKLAKKYK